MASDHLIKETNKLLERIAKASERTATALEKMVIEDDEEEALADDKDPQEESLREALRKFIGSPWVAVDSEVDTQQQRARVYCFGDIDTVTKQQANYLMMNARVDEIVFSGGQHQKDRIFRRFEGWVS